MFPRTDAHFHGWEERSQGDGLDDYRSVTLEPAEAKPRAFSRQSPGIPMSYDSSVSMQLCNDDLPYTPTNFHPSSIGYPESSQRTAFRMDSQPTFEESFAAEDQPVSTPPSSEVYTSFQHDYPSRFSSPGSLGSHGVPVDATVSMWTPQPKGRSYLTQHHQPAHHGGSIPLDRTSPPGPTSTSAQWSHQVPDSPYVQSSQSDANGLAASIPMREDSWFSVQQTSSSVTGSLAYSRGHVSRNLPATSLEHALDECEISSEVDAQSHDLDLTPDAGVVPSVGQTVGTEKRKKKSKMHQCEVCQKLFPRPSGLKTHMNTHNNTKPFACDFPGCNRSFTVRSNARRHLRIHGVAPETSTSSGSDYVVNFDEPMVPESQNYQLPSVPQKIKWMPPSLPKPEESESEFDELDEEPDQQRGPSYPTAPFDPAFYYRVGSETGEYFEDGNSRSDSVPCPHYPSQVKPSPP